MPSSTEDRFWDKVIKGPRPHDCWLWTGAVSDDGYGRYWIGTVQGQKAMRPQRYAHEILTDEELPSHVLLMHSCDIPLCVRATGGEDTHLVPGTRAENLLDRSQKRRHATPTPTPGVGAASAGRTSLPNPGSSAMRSQSTGGTNQ
jgi:hypothetical protein